MLAFLIKRYYGNVAYGRIYGVIFGVFYLGSGIGINAFAGRLHDATATTRRALRRGRRTHGVRGLARDDAEVSVRRRRGRRVPAEPAPQSA